MVVRKQKKKSVERGKMKSAGNEFSKSQIEREIEIGAEIIKKGGVVAFPTETVYGLGANAYSSKAVRKIFKLKGRPSDNPLIVHIGDKKDLERVAREIPKIAVKLVEKFWPGPLTLVLKKNKRIPPEVTAGLDTVAVRMPAHPVALKLIKKSGVPIAAPSANISGKPSPTKPEHVRKYFGEKVFVIEGGKTKYGVESTVLDLTSSQPTILRPGAITKEEIEKFLGKKVLIYSTEKISDSEKEKKREGKKKNKKKKEEKEGENKKYKEKKGSDDGVEGEVKSVWDVRERSEETEFIPKSPGMKYKHYSPNAKLILVLERKKIKDVLKKLVEEVGREGEKKEEGKRKEKEKVEEKEEKIKGRKAEQIKYGEKKKVREKEGEKERRSDLGKIGAVVLFKNRKLKIGKEIGKKFDFFVSGKSVDEVAQNLFDILIKLDEKYKIIVFEGVEEKGKGLAVMDRLKKASSEIIR